MQSFADRINRATRPALVFGAEVDRAGGWDAAVAVAERLGAPVFGGTLPDRVSFPESHPQYVGQLPMSIKGVGDALIGHDLVIVIGAQVFRYYAYVPGDYIPAGTDLLHLTADPAIAAAAPIGDSLLGDPALALQHLLPLVDAVSATPAVRKAASTPTPTTSGPPSLAEIFAALGEVVPADTVLVNEATSAMAQRRTYLPVRRSGSYFTTLSGGLGWAMPAAIGIALAERMAVVRRPILVTIGDGSFQYSVQALCTSAQHHLPIIFVVLVYDEYLVLKSFAKLEHAEDIPGLDIPGIDIRSLAVGFGCEAIGVSS